MRCLDSITDAMDMNFSMIWELVMDREAWHATVHGVAKSRTWLSDWTELNWMALFSNKVTLKHWELELQSILMGKKIKA